MRVLCRCGDTYIHAGEHRAVVFGCVHQAPLLCMRACRLARLDVAMFRYMILQLPWWAVVSMCMHNDARVTGTPARRSAVACKATGKLARPRRPRDLGLLVFPDRHQGPGALD